MLWNDMMFELGC